MSSKNSGTSDPRRLLFNLTDEINSNRSDKYIALLNFSVCYTWKIIKKSYKVINLKYQLQHGIKSVN